jgi:hypothetical protein
MRTAASNGANAPWFSRAAGLPVKNEPARGQLATRYQVRPLSTGEVSSVGVGSPSVAEPIAARFLRGAVRFRVGGFWSTACKTSAHQILPRKELLP